MIIGISNVHTGDLVFPGLLAVGLVWLGYLVIRLTDLWIDTMRRQSTMDQHTADALHLAAKPPYVGFDPPEIAPEDEPSWAGKASLELVPREQMVVLGGNPARFDVTGLVPSSGVLLTETPPETPAETSGRHALIQGDDTATGLMPAVDEDPVPAEEVGVS